MIPTVAPTITGAVALVQMRTLATETLTDEEIAQIISTAEEAFWRSIRVRSKLKFLTTSPEVSVYPRMGLTILRKKLSPRYKHRLPML
eukprot:UN18951